MFEFLNNFIHYKREVNQRYEGIWDIMLDGRASAFKTSGKQFKKGILMLVLNVFLSLVTALTVGSFIAYTGERGIWISILNFILWSSILCVPVATFIVFGIMKKFFKDHHWLFMFGATAVCMTVLTLLLCGLSWIGA